MDSTVLNYYKIRSDKELRFLSVHPDNKIKEKIILTPTNCEVKYPVNDILSETANKISKEEYYAAKRQASIIINTVRKAWQILG